MRDSSSRWAGDADADIARISAPPVRRFAPGPICWWPDANTGWSRHEAARVTAAISELDVFVEQSLPELRGLACQSAAAPPCRWCSTR